MTVLFENYAGGKMTAHLKVSRLYIFGRKWEALGLRHRLARADNIAVVGRRVATGKGHVIDQRPAGVEYLAGDGDAEAILLMFGKHLLPGGQHVRLVGVNPAVGLDDVLDHRVAHLDRPAGVGAEQLEQDRLAVAEGM